MTSEKNETTPAPPLWIQCIGTGLFTGYTPVASGTAGSILCIGILWFLPQLSWLWLFITAVLLFFIGTAVSNILSRFWGTDPGKVNIDEIAGMTVALIGLPKTWIFWTAALLLFRLFDIVKPPPAKRLESLPGGWGIMLDDIAAGFYANIAAQLLRTIL